MTRTEYRVTQEQLLKVRDYMEESILEGSTVKVVNGQGMAVYNLPIGTNEILSGVENVTLVINFISRRIITSGSATASRMTESELEGILGGKLKVKERLD